MVVVVVTYNSAHVVNDLLDSLPRALDGLVARTVVVDNSSIDDTRAAVRARSDCRLVEAPNRGYSAGINRGVAAAGGDQPVLVLNPDVRMHPGAIRTMMTVLAEPSTGIVAPLVREENGGIVLSLRREPSLGRALGMAGTGRKSLSEYVTDPKAYRTPQTPDWALGAVLLVSRACYDQLGGWDETYFLYSEETDFCLRARDHGWVTRYTPDASAVHIGGQSGQSPRIHSMQIINRVRLFSRRNGRAAALGYFALTVASEVSWILRGHAQSIESVRALLRPSTRPAELGCSDQLVPR